MTKSVRMQDVADRAGVSQPTVSIVFSGRRDVRISEETRKRVLSVAQELNYRPHGAARTLATGRTNAVAFVYDTTAGFLLHDPFCRDIFSAIISSSEASKFSLVFSVFDAETQKIRAVEEQLVDGVMYLAAKSPEAVEYLRASKLPFVLLNSDLETRGPVSAVLLDDDRAGTIAGQQVKKAGHTRAVFVAGSWKGRVAPSYAARAAAFRKVLPTTRMITLPLDGEIADSYRLGVRAASAVMQTKNTTVLVAANDQIAWGLHDALKARGVPIPGAFSLVGFDGLKRIFQDGDPEMATIAFDSVAIGQAGIDMLNGFFAGRNPGAARIAPKWIPGATLKKA